MSKLMISLVSVALLLGNVSAEAARMGGGRSVGRQSSNVTQSQSTPPATGAPGQASQGAAQSTAAKPGAAAPAAPAVAPRRPWAGMLGGLAAGLGLAWLAHSMGLGAGMGNVLMIALLAFAAFFAFRWFMRSRANAANGANTSGNNSLAFQGAGPGDARTPQQYSPGNVGNDASARPWERTGNALESTLAAAAPVGATGSGDAGEHRTFGSSAAGAAVGGSMIGSALAGAQSWGVPAGFDSEGFLTAAKRNFVTLQDAWDRSDITLLRGMMTDSMIGEIRTQLAEREGHIGAKANKTDVVMLDAKLLGIEELPDAYMASVEFSGMIREDAASGPSPFREVWNMTKPVSGGGGWLVAGVQALN